MATLWFSYSSSGGDLDTSIEPISSPYTIWWHVGHFLRQKAKDIGYDFKYVELTDTTPQTFEPADIIIGHTWFDGGFVNNALLSVAKHKFILQPYSHDMVSPGDVGMVLNLFNQADHLFLVTGEHWFNTMEQTPYAGLKAKATRLDMAINSAVHPHKKTRWNKPGERAVCVIGNDTPTKGFKNVAELARVSGFRLGHFGSGHPETFAHTPCVVLHGGVLFTPDNIAWICNEYDAVMALPLADANPTVLLEAAAWGLTVFCSKEAGYLPGKPFRELRCEDTAFNVSQIRKWQQSDDYTLSLESHGRRKHIEQHYTWSHFCSKLWSKVEQYL